MYEGSYKAFAVATCELTECPAWVMDGIDMPASHTLTVYAPQARAELATHGDRIIAEVLSRWRHKGHTSKLRVELEARHAPARQEAA